MSLKVKLPLKFPFLNLNKHLTEKQIADAEKRGIEMKKLFEFEDLDDIYFGKKL